ncbi:phenylalanine--tRNA ligase subunit beta [Paucibacter sp. PLA-PC-4]|uniref:phenylalanine--tRNA ligase subunit beta n=1 Tax=Paucibacter sp. PLA-PC-4 TaxID=2993655 RepID=UPI0022495061|nr:phenylalanine--tRNA ligase subunit beta [Paucibacter sp. PLA-PC-4]MCX2861188.1 phenylalanine--tRNA ligase subunit beta [Paucibacter sp. PLA-PC-4]
MQFPESWLRSFCNPALNTQELAELLTMSGLEVEELRPVAPPFHGIVVAEILTAEQHPNADKLRVCAVNAGGPEPLQIVCGAPNARAGIRVPLAMVGAELPPGEDGKPFGIKVGKLRGVESFGMLCSARELKLSEDHGGLLELAADAPIGQNIRDHLKLDDTLFTLKLTPNLAHALSVYGIAREVSALTGAPLLAPAFTPAEVKHQDKLPVRIEASDLCGRFSGRIVRGVNTQARTPAWMVDRLARCGQRSVSPLVDISNYVMFELGRPSHIFDLDKIDGELVVRWGRKGEQLKLLNGNTIEVDESVGVIANQGANGQVVESLAGIMGGDHTAVSNDTKNIYVEAAFWWPKAVMGRSRRYNFSTDAGHRFERGVDPAQTVEHIERITQLIIEICGGEAATMDDQITALPERKPVTLRVARAAKVIGMPLTQAQCAGVFKRLGLEFVESDAHGGTLTVTPPSSRFDIQIEEDLIEEVIRVLGYPNLPDTPPLAPVVGKVASESRRSIHALRHALAGRDYYETINFSFVEARWEQELAGNDSPIQLLNPIAAPLAVMRSSLIGSLINALRYNLTRKAPRVRLFEIGRVFLRDATVVESDTTIAGVRQPMRVGGLAFGAADQPQWSQRDRSVDFFDVKGDLEALFAPRQLRFIAADHPALHPGRSARVELDGEDVGVIGELHPKWRQGYELPSAPIVFELALDAVLARRLPQGQGVARQQSVQRDIAVVVGEGVTHEALMTTIAGAHDGLIRSARLFDVFKPTQAGGDLKEGERSMAVRLELLDDESTLTDERIEQAVAAVLAALAQHLGARLRG